MQLSELAFRQQFERFKKAVFLASKSEFRSFREGLPNKWEGYKDGIYTEGRKRLAWQSWTEEDVQSGIPIVERTIKAIEIEKTPEMKGSNLVDWDSRYGPERKSHKKLIEALGNNAQAHTFGEVLYGLYRDELPEAEVFGRFVQLAGRRYDLPAYLFFLKDWDRFMPISPTTFDKAFELLGINLQTSKHCSWENYTQFNDAMRSIQESLSSVTGLEDIRMIDAHSFCWMLVRLKPPKNQADT
jgi:hypothetical protein